MTALLRQLYLVGWRVMKTPTTPKYQGSC